MFLPTTREELNKLGWSAPDIIIVSGDTYIDSPLTGAAVIGKYLMREGFRVAIIAQPRLDSHEDITRLGEPRLFWGVTGGAVDSMVANRTATGRPRRSDDMTPGGANDRRPDRAVIAYSNLIRRHFKNTAPVVLGGIEASLRRITHYDFWDDSLRRPVLFDAKADYLAYGMCERAIADLARALRDDPAVVPEIRGLCRISKNPPPGYLVIPSHEECAADKLKFIEAFRAFYDNCDPVTARGICQRAGDRWLVQAPPAPNLDAAGLDAIYDMDFELDAHPYYRKQGAIKALETIRFSLATHRGCYGECNFCAIAVHQGRTVVSRSEGSILREARKISALRDFHGNLYDGGTPTGNMYGIECPKKLRSGACRDKRCLWPEACRSLPIDHSRQTALLKKLAALPGVKRVFVTSGIRYDMIIADEKNGAAYLEELARNHVSGQLKIAPEHTEDAVLALMGKPGKAVLTRFCRMFEEASARAGKRQFLTYYLIAAHPGCTERDMKAMRDFASKQLRITPEQVQVFTPTPSTFSTLMYYTGLDPFTMEPVFVERAVKGKERQKETACGAGGGFSARRPRS